MNHADYLEQTLNGSFFKGNYCLNSCLYSNCWLIVFSRITFIPCAKIQLTSP